MEAASCGHLIQGRSYVYTKRICVHIRITKYMGRFYHNSDGFLMLFVQSVYVEPILISQNQILTEFVMMLVSPLHRHPLMICYHLTQNDYTILYNLPLPRMCLSWQTALTLMRRLWVNAVCLYFPFSYAQLRTLNFRLASSS